MRVRASVSSLPFLKSCFKSGIVLIDMRRGESKGSLDPMGCLRSSIDAVAQHTVESGMISLSEISCLWWELCLNAEEEDVHISDCISAPRVVGYHPTE